MSKTEYKRLGDYIRPVDVRNRGLKIHLSQGICNAKYFQNPKQVADNPETHKVVRTGQFAYNRATTRNGEKISIALREGPDCTVSSAYQVFEVVDENLINPKYLMMWFKRPEFDRLAIYYSHGSAHEFFEWEAMCDVMLPIPSITRQREIVSEYETLTNRIRLNNQMIQHLEATAQALYRKTFVDNIDKENLPDGWRMGTLGEFGEVITGKTPSSNNPEDFGYDMPFVTPGDFAKYHKFAIGTERSLSEIGIKRLKGKVLPNGSVIVTCIGSDMGKVAIASEECITNQQMNSIVVSHCEYSDYLFYVLSFMSTELKAMALGSSTMPLLNKSDFERIKVVFPPDELIVKFSQQLNTCNETTILKQKENIKLTELQSLLLAKMGQ